MQTETTAQPPQTPPSMPLPMLRRSAITLSAAFIAGWLGCLGVVQWRQPAHAQTPEATTAAVAAAEKTVAPAKTEPTAEIIPVAQAPAPVAPPAPVVAPQPAPALAQPEAAAPAVTERQQERDAVAQLFAKNRDNLRVLTSR
jgi:hypothetical protein